MKPFVLAAGLVLAAFAGCADDATPRPTAPALLPLARTEVSGTAWRGEIVVLGGLTKDGNASARADVYSPTANRWRRLPDLPVGLHHAAAVEFRGRVFAVGGYTVDSAQWQESARMFSLGVGNRAWREEPALPASRGAHAAVALGDRIVAVGGVSESKIVGTSVVYTPETGWAAGPTMARAREHLAATVDAGRIFVIAGRANGENFTDVDSWDGLTPEWRREPSLNDSRGGIAAATVGGRPCVAGGEEAAGTIASVECLFASQWRRVGELAVPRHGVAVVAVGEGLHVIGGGAQPGLFVTRAHEVLRL